MANRKLTNKEYKERLSKVRPHIKLVDDYEGLSKPIRHKCIKHNYVWRVAPSNITRISDCPLCSNKGTQNVPIENRIESKTKKVGNCWEWQGATNTGGYGITFYNGRMERVHRVSYALNYNKGIISNYHILHHCDNRLCINPLHLYEGTNKDNVRDRVERQRTITFKGHSNGNSKLDKSSAKYILVRGYYLKKIGKKNYLNVLSKKFNVSNTNCSDIINGKIWPTLDYIRNKLEDMEEEEIKRWSLRIKRRITIRNKQ